MLQMKVGLEKPTHCHPSSTSHVEEEEALHKSAERHVFCFDPWNLMQSCKKVFSQNQVEVSVKSIPSR